MRVVTEYFILQENSAEALLELVRQAIRSDRTRPLGHPFPIVKPDGSLCLQVLAEGTKREAAETRRIVSQHF